MTEIIETEMSEASRYSQVAVFKTGLNYKELYQSWEFQKVAVACINGRPH